MSKRCSCTLMKRRSATPARTFRVPRGHCSPVPEAAKLNYAVSLTHFYRCYFFSPFTFVTSFHWNKLSLTDNLNRLSIPMNDQRMRNKISIKLYRVNNREICIKIVSNLSDNLHKNILFAENCAIQRVIIHAIICCDFFQ